MMIRKLGYCCVLILVLTSCETYTTFYKETARLSSATVKRAQRLDLRQEATDSMLKLVPKFENLRSLNLTARSASEIDTVLKLVTRPELLRVLILDSTNLKQLPESIRRFSNLKQLALNHTPHLDFQTAFYTLEGLPLVFLNLQHNQLTVVPEGIGKLKHLTDLNLSHNQLTTGFFRLQTIPRLKSLWLTANALEVLPEPLFQLKTLKNLYIEHNSLSHIPEGITALKKVWVIHAGHNAFTELPEAFSKMNCLLLLHINDCPIERIPESYLHKDSKVAGLLLDNNQLSEKAKRYWRKTFQHFFILSL